MQINNTTIAITSHSPALQIYNVTVGVERVTTVSTSTGKQEIRGALATNWPATIKWKSGKEKVMFDKDTYFQDASVLMRVIPGETITTKDRIVYLGNDYEIVDVIDINNLGKRLRIAIRRVV